MAWVRWGDNSHDHPILMNVSDFEDFDDRLLNEVHGFISRCASASGSHSTDYVIKHGTAVMIAGSSRVNKLVEVAKFAGYMTEIEHQGRKAYKLVDNDHDFLHLRLKAEIDWEAQRKKDNSNPAKIVPVRMRDGDACRWCGCVVNWGTRSGGRNGTYDHLVPGEEATVDTYVVSCGSCNASRGDGSNPGGFRELLPVPDKPYFSPHTIAWIASNKWAREHGYEPPSRPKKVVPPGDLAPHAAESRSTSQNPVTTASSAPAGERPGNQPENAGTPDQNDAPAPRPDTQSENATSNKRTDHQSENATKPGTSSGKGDAARIPRNPVEGQSGEADGPGRVGTGRVGSGRDGSPAVPTSSRYPNSESSPAPRSSRGRRSRRSRKPSHRKPSPPPTSGDHQ